MNTDLRRNKKVLCPMQNKHGKTYWLRVGNAYVNKDGSTNVYLDAYPANGKLQIRDLDDRDFQRPGSGSSADAGAGASDANLPF